MAFSVAVPSSCRRTFPCSLPRRTTHGIDAACGSGSTRLGHPGANRPRLPRDDEDLQSHSTAGAGRSSRRARTDLRFHPAGAQLVRTLQQNQRFNRRPKRLRHRSRHNRTIWTESCAEFLGKLAPQAGLEPATLRLTAGCSAIELLRNAEKPLTDSGGHSGRSNPQSLLFSFFFRTTLPFSPPVMPSCTPVPITPSASHAIGSHS